MIVMKFGGTSLADADRIASVAEIVRARLAHRPVVVLSAMAGVTDLLVEAVAAARRGDRDAVDRVVGEMAKRHRWAIAGALHGSSSRHDLELAVDAILEELRLLLRSVRTLGEGTPRAADTLLSFGELLCTRIVTAVLVARGVPARWSDPREVVITDGRHGAAEPQLQAMTERCRERMLPVIEAGEVPVIGGFVGCSAEGVTTTLGRGGGDTSAAALGAALGASEIQIWTDVEGLMTADPRSVAGARRLPSVTFAEAAELAYYGARVLHPASIAPAVARGIPVRVLNSLDPGGPGTVILDRPEPGARPLASVTCRRGVRALRAVATDLRANAGFLPRVLRVLEARGAAPDVVVASEVAVTLVVSATPDADAMLQELGAFADLETVADLAIVCVVGAGLAADGDIRRSVLEALAAHGPVVLGIGARSTSVAAAVPEGRLEDTVRDIHHRFFE